jgi:hypothetical protein
MAFQSYRLAMLLLESNVVACGTPTGSLWYRSSLSQAGKTNKIVLGKSYDDYATYIAS